MKIKQDNDFRPITITIITKQEFFAFVEIIDYVTGEEKKLRSRGLEFAKEIDQMLSKKYEYPT